MYGWLCHLHVSWLTAISLYTYEVVLPRCLSCHNRSDHATQDKIEELALTRYKQSF